MRAEGYMMSEHVPTGSLTGNFACRAGSFAIPVNRVQRRAWGRHSISEYAPPARLIASIACGDYNFHIPFIRVYPPQKRAGQAHPVRAFALWQTDFQQHVRDSQFPHSHHPGVPSAEARRASTPCASICFLTN